MLLDHLYLVRSALAEAQSQIEQDIDAVAALLPDAG